MRSLFGSPPLLAVGFGCLLAAMPAQAQTQTCPGKTSSSTSSSSSGSATASTSNSAGSTQATLTMIQNQITQLQAILVQLQIGQTTPAASTGLTTAQAIQIIQQRIVALRRLAAQVSSSTATQNQVASLRASGRR